jgi:hypothetical protein
MSILQVAPSFVSGQVGPIDTNDYSCMGTTVANTAGTVTTTPSCQSADPPLGGSPLDKTLRAGSVLSDRRLKCDIVTVDWAR